MERVVLFFKSELLRCGLGQVLAEEHGHQVVQTATVEELLSAAATRRPGIVVFELQDDPTSHWSEHLAALRRFLPSARLVGVSPNRSVDSDVERRVFSVPYHLSAVVSLRDSTADLLAALGVTVGTGATPRRHDAGATTSSAPDARVALTRRELDVLRLLGTGLTTVEIARRLGIVSKTIENHKQRVYAKLGVQSQSHAVAVAMQEGMIPATVSLVDVSEMTRTDVSEALAG